MGVRLVKKGVDITGGIGTIDHSELINREEENQHPIEAITDLRETLDFLEILNANDTTTIDLTWDPATRSLKADLVGIGIEDTDTVDHTWDNTTNTLKSDVKVNESVDNAIVKTGTGLFVDKSPEIDVEDTNSGHLYFNGKGMSLYEMYQEGQVFSHNGSNNNIANATEANAWYYDSSLASFVQPKNTNTFTGFVSNEKYIYRTYTHQARLRSTDADDDVNGLVIGYVKDASGSPHTLTAWVWKGNNGNSSSFEVWYNYNLPNAQRILYRANYPTNYSSFKGWNQASNGLTMYVSKQANIVEVKISKWNSTVLDESSLFTFDLNNYSWGHLFAGGVQYGYCNLSQAYSFFTHIIFNGKGPLKCDVIVSPDKDNMVEIRNNGVYVSAETVKTIASTIDVNSITINVTQTGHGFKVGNAVYEDADSKYKLAIAEDNEKLNVVGIVSEVKSANEFVITTAGLVKTTAFNAYPNGTMLFLNEKTAGNINDTQGDIVKPIAIKITDGIVVNIQRSSNGESTSYTDAEILDAINDCIASLG